MTRLGTAAVAVPSPDRTRPWTRLSSEAMLRFVTALYLVYLAIPIALLVVGSFGALWLNTLLPTGSW